MTYPLVFYTNRFIPARFDAMAWGLFVLIRPEYRGNRGLLEHELTHIKQWVMTMGLHHTLCGLSQRYYLWSEVQAFRRQLEFEPCSEYFAKKLITNYNLDITYADALRRLQ